MTTPIASKAATIRKALKTELGLTAKQVSVRAGRGGSINVTIKAPGISIAKVKEIAERQQSIRYDESTGSILQGGNTLVFVTLDSSLTDALAASILPWVEGLEVGNRIHSVPGTESIGKLGVDRGTPWMFGLWSDGRSCVRGDGAHGIACQIASRLVEADIDTFEQAA